MKLVNFKFFFYFNIRLENALNFLCQDLYSVNQLTVQAWNQKLMV